MADDHGRWWRGARGEWLVVIQGALMVLVFFGPRTLLGQPKWPFPAATLCPIVGALLMIGGGDLLVSGLVKLGAGLTPLPYPSDRGQLIETGPFACVRHPMYCGGLALALGWAICTRGWLTMIYVVILFLFLDLKSRREERWLMEKYPGYGDYRQRVRKLIPFIY